MEDGAFIQDTERFAKWKTQVEDCFHIERSLPEQVFAANMTHFRFEEFDWVMSSNFWPQVQNLCERFGDSSLLIAVLDPDPLKYYKNEFGHVNWAEISACASSEDYWDMLNHFPKGCPADSLIANSEKIVWLPPSGMWAVWGERSYEVSVLGSQITKISHLWNDVEWALKTALPYAFVDGVVPADFAEQLRHNFSDGEKSRESS